jgi:Cu+-exporting ATPase
MRNHNTTDMQLSGGTVLDPVCGMTIEAGKAAGDTEYKGTRYWFCSKSCLGKFVANPGRYTTRTDAASLISESAIQAHPAGSEYTCPMHPEVRQNKPGSCPTCGMALELVTISAPTTRTEYTCPMHPQIIRSEPGACPICGMTLEPRHSTGEEVNPELIDMTRRFWAAVVLSTPILLAMIGDFLPGMPLRRLLDVRTMNWIEFALATPVVIWAGWPLLERGWASVINWSLNMFTLIAMGTVSAYAYSVVATLAPSIFPRSFRNPSGQVDVYFEPAAIIVT